MIALALTRSLGIAKAAATAMAPLAPWFAVAVLGAVVWHNLPVVGPAARLDRAAAETSSWKIASEDWERSSRNWKASFTASETLRKQETSDAIVSVASEIERCAARVTEARQSARVIERIVTKEPTYDANRCPVRELVDPDQLRQALQPGR